MKNKITLELTEQEKSYLTIETNIKLRNYKVEWENDDMLEGYNKLYKALTGENHNNYIRWKEAKK